MLYILKINHAKFLVKVGVSNHIKNRLETHKRNFIDGFKVVRIYDCPNDRQEESWIKGHWSSHRYHGNEIFEVSSDQLDNLLLKLDNEYTIILRKTKPSNENIWIFAEGYDGFYLCKLCHNVFFYRSRPHECQPITETDDALTHAACIEKHIKMKLVRPVYIHPFLEIFFPSKLSYYMSQCHEPYKAYEIPSLENQSYYNLKKKYILHAIERKSWSSMKDIIRHDSSTISCKCNDNAWNKVKNLMSNIEANEDQASDLKLQLASIESRNRLIRLKIEEEIISAIRIEESSQKATITDTMSRELLLRNIKPETSVTSKECPSKPIA